MLLYHGSSNLFSAFDLSKAGESTGVKFGFGVYLTEVEESAVHYSQPRHMEQLAPNHYLYTVEIPDLTPTNHLVSALPVHEEIVSKVQAKLGVEAPAKVLQKGLEFRKWVGMTLLGTKKNTFAGEKAAADLLNSLGVLYNVWPRAQGKKDGPRNVTVFSEANVKILKVEHIDVICKMVCNKPKYVLVGRRDV